MIKSIYVSAVSKFVDSLGDVDLSLQGGITILFDDIAEADAFASKFPKYCKVTSEPTIRGDAVVQLSTWCPVDERTGDVNEAAVKRANKIRAVMQDMIATKQAA